MMGVELKDEAAAQRLIDILPEEGLVSDRFLFRPSAFRIAPPLIISDSQRKEITQRIIKCLDKL